MVAECVCLFSEGFGRQESRGGEMAQRPRVEATPDPGAGEEKERRRGYYYSSSCNCNETFTNRSAVCDVLLSVYPVVVVCMARLSSDALIRNKLWIVCAHVTAVQQRLRRCCTAVTCVHADLQTVCT